MISAHEVDYRLPAVDAYLSAYEKFDGIVTQLRSAQAKRMTHTQLEKLLEIEGRELLRRLLQAHLDERSPGTVAERVVGSDGQARTHQRSHTRQLETIFGHPVPVILDWYHLEKKSGS